MTSRSRPLALSAIALVLVFCTAGQGAAVARRAPSTHQIIMEGTSFHPDTLTIKAGDTVQWVNEDFFAHTATSKDDSFDSPDIAPGKSWKYTAKKKGEFPYYCSLHRSMKAVLKVE